MSIAATNNEIMEIIKSISRERGIKRQIVVDAVQDAIKAVVARKCGYGNDIQVKINDQNSNIEILRVKEDPDHHNMDYPEVLSPESTNTNLYLEDYVLEKLPFFINDRVDIKMIKDFINKRINTEIRKIQIQEHIGKQDTIVSGFVKSIEFGNVIVDLGEVEAILEKKQQIKNETFKVNDRIKAYVTEVSFREHGPQIFLSRSSKEFIAALMKLEILEIYDNTIEIKAIARESGVKSKVAVFSHDITVDAVSLCIGAGGNRIKNIINEINGEKIDIVGWDSDLANFIINAIAPAKISKIIMRQEQNRAQIVIAKDQYSIAIGKNGQNVRLASKLTNTNISIVDEEEHSVMRTKTFNYNVEGIMHALDVDELIGQLLVSASYTSVEQIAMTSIKTIATIEGFSHEIAEEIVNRAIDYVKNDNQEFLDKIKDLGIEDDFFNKLVSIIPLKHILRLVEHGIKSYEDLECCEFAEIQDIILDDLINEQCVKKVFALRQKSV